MVHNFHNRKRVAPFCEILVNEVQRTFTYSICDGIHMWDIERRERDWLLTQKWAYYWEIFMKISFSGVVKFLHPWGGRRKGPRVPNGIPVSAEARR